MPPDPTLLRRMTLLNESTAELLAKSRLAIERSQDRIARTEAKVQSASSKRSDESSG